MALLWSAVLSGQACGRGPFPLNHVVDKEARQVMALRVRLGDGFKDDTVSVRVNGEQVYRKSGVTTYLRLSRAESVDLESDARTVRLEVAVDGGPSAARDIQLPYTPFVEANVVDGRLELQALPGETPML